MAKLDNCCSYEHREKIEDDFRKKEILFNEMVDCHRNKNKMGEVYRGLAKRYFIEYPTSFYKFTRRKPLSEKYRTVWCDENGEWDHHGGSHNRLGEKYAGFMILRNDVNKFRLKDSPDFAFYMKGNWCEGDIGRCSGVAIFNAIRSIEKHSLWVSVLSEETEIVVEFGYNVVDTLSNTLEKSFTEAE